MGEISQTKHDANTGAALRSKMTCDVFVIGGGPGGSTVAALLAGNGFDVVLVDKDRHPRFHIGESLLPFNLPLFEQLGVKDEIDAIGMPKYGIEFVSPWHEKSIQFEFANAWDKGKPSSYQVRRSSFDQVLLKNAARRGARVIEGCRVKEVEFLSDGGAIVTGCDDEEIEHRWRTKFVVDASGRDAFLASHFGTKRRNGCHNTASVFGHFTGARRLPGKAEGHISIFWFQHGWFWSIPLADGTTSVGVVCGPDYIKQRGTDVTNFFLGAIARCPALAERLKDAQLTGPPTATGNYSYKADRMAGRSYIILGDAFAFIDPVFSTGVYLAMKSAFIGAEAVKATLKDPRRGPAEMARFDRTVRRGLDRFTWYIYHVNSPAMRDLFMAPRNYFRVEEALLSLLAGDIFRRSPAHKRLLFFKLLYYLKTLGYWWRGGRFALARRPV